MKGFICQPDYLEQRRAEAGCQVPAKSWVKTTADGAGGLAASANWSTIVTFSPINKFYSDHLTMLNGARLVHLHTGFISLLNFYGSACLCNTHNMFLMSTANTAMKHGNHCNAMNNIAFQSQQEST